MGENTKFKDCLDLHRLSFYRLDDAGRLVARPEEVGRVVDFHTHLGFSFVFAPRLNLFKKTGPVKFFFPYRGNPIDLDVYSASCFTEKSAKEMVHENLRSGWTDKGFVGTQTIPNMIADMNRIGVTHSVVLALDFPWGLSGNSKLYLNSLRHEPRLICYASVHPYATRRAEKVERFLEMGAAGIKLHPAEMLYRANNPRLRDIFEVCQKRRVPVLFHSGASPVAPKWQQDLPAIKYFAEPVRDFPELIFIFGHSGIEEYQKVIELGKKHDNVYMEISGQPAHRILEMVNGIGADRVLFGSDWPFYPIELPLAKALIATEGKLELREKILYKNARRLLKEYGGVEI